MIATQTLKRAAMIGLTAVKEFQAPDRRRGVNRVACGQSVPSKVTVMRYSATRSDGTPAVVIARTTLIDVTRPGDTEPIYSEGYTTLATGRCETLTWRFKGVYEVDGSREIIRCDDPNAP